jgi:hypothetical protein
VSVYRHRNSPYWQFDFQRAGYRFCGSTEVPKTKPKREAEAVEAQERRAAERLVEEVRRSGRQPMTFAAAADRWWNEVGQHSAETDLFGAVEWLKAQIGPAKPLHLVGNDDVTRGPLQNGGLTRSALDTTGAALSFGALLDRERSTVPSPFSSAASFDGQCYCGTS